MVVEEVLEKRPFRIAERCVPGTHKEVEDFDVVTAK
jgi:hypothetical protein